ncbi:MAG: stage V sporulation protein AD [Eubacteriales bacterium]
MENQRYTATRGVINFKNKIKMAETACAGGKIEKQGPYCSLLDVYCDTDDLKTGTFEKAESEMVRLTVNALMAKAKIKDQNVDILLGGDLINQCTSTAYGLEEYDIPYLGLYGACSTFALGMLTAAILIDSGHINNAIVIASSHFCSAERQFRFPLEYGSVSATTAQTTVTGAGAVLLSRAEPLETGVMVTGGMYGIVSDRGIRDAANMGAAMATAAADTILRYLGSTGEPITAYDRIATGDLGREGMSLTKEMLMEKGVCGDGVLCDCGEMIYDLQAQDVGCGGSGCGCSAVVTAGHFYDALKNGEVGRMALIGTGALMSPQSLQQGLSIPAVGHLVRLERIC